MTRQLCQFVRQADGTWLVSLGSGVPSRDGRRRSRRATKTGTEPPRAASVIDEGAHAASMVVHRASCEVIFDGVLYNRAELSESLDTLLPPSGATDADVILRAYLRWGEGVLHKLRGIFALLIWDERQNTLLCARDQLGVYPLFYADTGRSLLFSTSIDTLVRDPRVSDTVGRAALADHLCYRTQRLEETFYEAVERVPPGYALRVRGSSRERFRYWDPVPDPTDVDWVTEGELERFDELLDQAVNRCMQLGQAGIFLSGGLDSVSVAAVATDASRRLNLPEPWALSLVFPDPECNEEAVQRRVAAGLGLPHELVPFGDAGGPRGVLAAGMEISSAQPAPLFNPWAPAYEHLALEGKRRGCRVIMSGGGGDEWLTVSPYYAADLLRGMDFRGLYSLWNSMHRSLKLSRSALLRNLLWTFGARPWLSQGARKVLRRTAPGLLQRRWHRSIARTTPGWIAPDPALRQVVDQRMQRRMSERPEPKSFYMDEGRLSLEHPLISMEMEEDHESWRRTGVRQLMPYWDPDLIDFLYRTPPELLNKGEYSKALVRQTVARRFPRLDFERQKKVLATNFLSSLLRDEGGRLWRGMGGAPALAELGIVDAAALGSTMSELFSTSRPPHETHRIRDILLTEAWLRPRLRESLPLADEGRLSVGTQ